MMVSQDPEIHSSAHPQVFLDFPERWRSRWLIWRLSVVIKRYLHELFPKAHHRNLDAGARDLEILKEPLSRPSVVPHGSH